VRRGRAARPLLALGLALAVAGCGGDAAEGGGPVPTTAPDAGRFTNPVLARSFADPHLLKVEDTWYAYATGDLAANLQVAERPEGSFQDLRSRGAAAGPGGQAVVRAGDGGLWLAYHAWDSAAVGDEAGGQRAMWLDRLRFQDGRPRVDGPTETPQEAP
jgi:beta-xylosidase